MILLVVELFMMIKRDRGKVTAPSAKADGFYGRAKGLQPQPQNVNNYILIVFCLKVKNYLKETTAIHLSPEGDSLLADFL